MIFVCFALFYVFIFKLHLWVLFLYLADLFVYKTEGLRNLRAKRRSFSFVLHGINVGSHESELSWVGKKSLSLSSNTAKS